MTSPMRHLASCRAVLLDMDGTLVDSGAAVEATWRAWARDNGLDPATVLAVCHGPDAATTVRRFLPGIGAAELARHVAAHLERECADIDGVIPAPGAPELVAWLDERRLPWGVVTNAHLRLARARLGVEPRRVAGVEDSAPGLEAARAAGTLVVAVGGTREAGAECDVACDDLHELRRLLASAGPRPSSRLP